MILPRKDENGNYYISYSQISAWNEAKGFNSNLSGKHKYIKQYFLGETSEDNTGFGQFGKDVEDYITLREGADKFTDSEKVVLDKIKPLGNYQKKIKLLFNGFYLLGFIDDHNDSLVKVRDYKTASKKSAQKYSGDDYHQLDIYGLAIEQETGKFPEELEVCIIERLGNGFKGGRDVMSVGNEIWYVKRNPNKLRLKNLNNYIINTVNEISEYYDIFLQLNQKIK